MRAKSSRSSQSACQARSTSWARHADLASANSATTCGPRRRGPRRRSGVRRSPPRSSPGRSSGRAHEASGPVEIRQAVHRGEASGALSRWVAGASGAGAGPDHRRLLALLHLRGSVPGGRSGSSARRIGAEAGLRVVGRACGGPPPTGGPVGGRRRQLGRARRGEQGEPGHAGHRRSAGTGRGTTAARGRRSVGWAFPERPLRRGTSFQGGERCAGEGAVEDGGGAPAGGVASGVGRPLVRGLAAATVLALAVTGCTDGTRERRAVARPPSASPPPRRGRR